jgi:flagellar hook-associated protein 3 FlgL
VKGAPATGDAFTLAPSKPQSLFTTLANLVSTLQTPAATPGASTQVANGVAAALQDIDQGVNNVLTLRAGAGAYMTELDALTSSLSSRTVQGQQTLSNLQDLDYNKALSDFARQQVALQAAQQSFTKVSGLSLFNYLQP